MNNQEKLQIIKNLSIILTKAKMENNIPLANKVKDVLDLCISECLNPCD